MSRFNLSALAVRNPAVTLFLIIAVLLSGAFAFSKLGRAEDPSFTVKVMTITAVWPGATAWEMQEQVADRLEKRLQELDYYDRVETTAQPGFVSMKVQFLNSTPPALVPELFYQTRKKLSDEASKLPDGVAICPVTTTTTATQSPENCDLCVAQFALAGGCPVLVEGGDADIFVPEGSQPCSEPGSPGQCSRM